MKMSCSTGAELHHQGEKRETAEGQITQAQRASKEEKNRKFENKF